MSSISSIVVDRAEIRFHESAEVLRPFVGCFWVVTLEPGATIRVVPDGSSTIAVQLQEGRSPKRYLRGPVVQPDERHFESPAMLIGVRLRPGVGFLLSGIAAYGTVGRRIPLATLAPFSGLVERLAGAETPTTCIDILQRFLVERLRQANVHSVVADALREIELGSGCRSVADIAASCRVSPRHLNRLMRMWVGFGAKRFSQVIRLQATLESIDRAPTRSVAALAGASGYFDQAHLTLDLTRFTGATPRVLASSHVADFSKTRCH